MVASEVKNLASQTQQATEEIGGQIDAMLERIEGSVSTVQRIREAVDDANETMATIAGAAKQQSASTDEIAAAVEGVAGCDAVGRITEMSQQSETTSFATREMRSSADELAKSGDVLGQEARKFPGTHPGDRECRRLTGIAASSGLTASPDRDRAKLSLANGHGQRFMV